MTFTSSFLDSKFIYPTYTYNKHLLGPSKKTSIRNPQPFVDIEPCLCWVKKRIKKTYSDCGQLLIHQTLDFDFRLRRCKKERK